MENSFDMKNIEFVEFNPISCSSEDWNLYHEFREKRHYETNPDDPLTDKETREKTMKMQMQHPEFEISLFSIKDKSTKMYVGDMSFGIFRETSESYEGNKFLMQFNLELLPEYRRKGIGTKALSKVCEFAKDNQKQILIANSSEDDGKAFLKTIGAHVAQSGVENRLDLEKVNWKMVSEWAEAGPKRSPGTELKLVSTIPEEIIEKYSKVYTETMNQQPMGDLEIDDIIHTPELLREMQKRWTSLGRKHLTYMTIEPNGDISGLTEVLYRPEKENMIEQLLTGVQENYRGKGLGKWLKAQMLLKVKEEFPQITIVSTGNATTNAPMISINDRLGFEVYKEGITGQMKLDDLEKYLEGK